MFVRFLLATAGMALVVGCAAVPAQPKPGPESPTNPNAAEAPLPTPSQTLAIADAAKPPIATDPALLTPESKGREHEHGAPSMRHDVPATQPGENAALSAPRFTPTTGPATSPATKYTCAMHPEVVSDQPGKCPKCGMKLVPKKLQPAASHDHDAKGGHQ
jgi:hypothetical protein